jgi:hypothetical protein
MNRMSRTSIAKARRMAEAETADTAAIVVETEVEIAADVADAPVEAVVADAAGVTVVGVVDVTAEAMADTVVAAGIGTRNLELRFRGDFRGLNPRRSNLRKIKNHKSCDSGRSSFRVVKLFLSVERHKSSRILFSAVSRKCSRDFHWSKQTSVFLPRDVHVMERKSLLRFASALAHNSQ